MAEAIIHEYQAILTAARGLPAAEQWRLAKELVRGLGVTVKEEKNTYAMGV